MNKDKHHKAYAMILQRLLKGKTLTASQFAQETGNVKLSSRVGELFEYGYPFIRKQWINRPNGKRIMKYWIDKSDILVAKELAVKFGFIK
jgi:hypothetical protein